MAPQLAADLTSVNRVVAAPTARGQTTVEPIPAAAHEANRETAKVVTTVALAEVVAAMAATREATGAVEVAAAAAAALSWTQATKPLFRRDSQHRR